FTYVAYSKERTLKQISWSDIQNGIRYIWKEFRKLKFKPDIILSPDPKGGILAYLLENLYDDSIFINIGQAVKKGTYPSALHVKENHTVISTNRWEVFLSKEIETVAKKDSIKVLIVDDFVLSGDFNYQLLEKLTEIGYKKENILVCCLVVTRVAISSAKAPDFYWKIVDDEDFYFPWGKAE
ncbi:MAG: hypothetical protein IKX58_06275, partial [Clostridia bacterium]|nr:hypothetical protein [Clostridia bacterium]